MFLARIYVTLKPTVNDPQGLTVLGALRNLGIDSVSEVRVGKYLEVQVSEEDRTRAAELVHQVCNQLLANPVIEEYRFDLEDTSPAG